MDGALSNKQKVEVFNGTFDHKIIEFLMNKILEDNRLLVDGVFSFGHSHEYRNKYKEYDFLRNRFQDVLIERLNNNIWTPEEIFNGQLIDCSVYGLLPNLLDTILDKFPSYIFKDDYLFNISLKLQSFSNCEDYLDKVKEALISRGAMPFLGSFFNKKGSCCFIKDEVKLIAEYNKCDQDPSFNILSNHFNFINFIEKWSDEIIKENRGLEEYITKFDIFKPIEYKEDDLNYDLEKYREIKKNYKRVIEHLIFCIKTRVSSRMLPISRLILKGVQ